MTWWAAAYFALYVTFSAWSLLNDARSGSEPPWAMASEAASDVFLLGPALSFWVPAIREALAPVALPSYAIGAAIFLGLGFRSYRKHLAEDDLSFRGKVFVASSSLLLIAAVSGPVLLWGFMSSVLAVASGT